MPTRVHDSIVYKLSQNLLIAWLSFMRSASVQSNALTTSVTKISFRYTRELSIYILNRVSYKSVFSVYFFKFLINKV